jgi:hypothetical protein
MAEKKKPKSVEDIINDMQSVRDKDFKTRIAKFEDFHKPENQHALRFQQHAEYVIWGNPGDRKNYPGAYEVAYQKLDSIAKDNDDKLGKVDDIMAILHSYADHFLEKAMGSRFKDAIKDAKEAGLDDDEMMEMKNTLLANYLRDRNGRPIMKFLDKDQAKKLKGKTKMEVITYLRGVSENTAKQYTSHLISKATEDLIQHYDIAALAKHVKPKFDEAGFKPEDHYLTKPAALLAQHYGILLSGGDVTENGYKKVTKEKKKD